MWTPKSLRSEACSASQIYLIQCQGHHLNRKQPIYCKLEKKIILRSCLTPSNSIFYYIQTDRIFFNVWIYKNFWISNVNISTRDTSQNKHIARMPLNWNVLWAFAKGSYICRSVIVSFGSFFFLVFAHFIASRYTKRSFTALSWFYACFSGQCCHSDNMIIVMRYNYGSDKAWCSKTFYFRNMSIKNETQCVYMKNIWLLVSKISLTH